MALDPSIILGIKPPQFQSPLEMRMQMAQLQNADSTNKLSNLMYGEKQRDINGNLVLNDAYKNSIGADGTIDRNKLFSAIAVGGQGAKLSGIQKGLTEQDAAGVDLANKKLAGQKTGIEVTNMHREKSAQKLGGFINDPELTQQKVLDDLQSQVVSGELTKEQAQGMAAKIPTDPEQIRGVLRGVLAQVMKPSEQYAASSSKAEKQDFGGTTGAVEGNPNMPNFGKKLYENDKTNTPGELLSDRGSNNQVMQTDNGTLLVNKRTATAQSVTDQNGNSVAGLTKPLNDSQSKALGFGTRMQESDKVLKQLGKEKTFSSVPGSRAPLIGGVISAFSPENNQMLDQAKRDFMTAILRRESGAAISSGEFDTADKQYFPQIGDGQKTIKQKERNRELAIAGVLIEVPEKYRKSLTPPTNNMNPETSGMEAEMRRRGLIK